MSQFAHQAARLTTNAAKAIANRAAPAVTIKIQGCIQRRKQQELLDQRFQSMQEAAKTAFLTGVQKLSLTQPPQSTVKEGHAGHIQDGFCSGFKEMFGKEENPAHLLSMESPRGKWVAAAKMMLSAYHLCQSYEHRLRKAILNNDLNQVATLISSGVDLSVRDAQLNNLLHLAAKSTEPKIIVELLKRLPKKYLAMQNKQGDTPLSVALQAGNDSVASLLLAATSVEVMDLSNKEGNTALHIAVKQNNIPTIVTLIMSGASFTIQNTQGHTPYDILIDRMWPKPTGSQSASAGSDFATSFLSGIAYALITQTAAQIQILTAAGQPASWKDFLFSKINHELLGIRIMSSCLTPIMFSAVYHKVLTLLKDNYSDDQNKLPISHPILAAIIASIFEHAVRLPPYLRALQKQKNISNTPIIMSCYMHTLLPRVLFLSLPIALKEECGFSKLESVILCTVPNVVISAMTELIIASYMNQQGTSDMKQRITAVWPMMRKMGPIGWAAAAARESTFILLMLIMSGKK